MLKYVYTIILIVCYTALYAQKPNLQTITGLVKTTDGYPAEFITVQLENMLYQSQTNDKGYFELKAPAGDYVMRVFSILAHKVDIPVSIIEGANEALSIIIMEDKTELDEVIVVTGQFSKQSLKNSVYKVKVISSAKIQQKAATSIESLLNTEIGVRLSNDIALGETDLELMGMSGNNVKVLIDGVPVVDRNAAKQSLNQIDINTIERIEIVEGPMSVIYGTDALAGVINIITKKSSVKQDKNTFSVGVRLLEESVGNEYSFISGEGIHNKSVNLNFGHKTGVYASGGFSQNATDGWNSDKEGREKTWQPKTQYMYNAALGYKNRDLNVWYKLDYLDEKITTPFNLQENSLEETDTEYYTKRLNNQVQTDWKLNNSLNVNAVVSYQNYDRKSRTLIKDISNGDKWLSIEEGAQDTSKIKTWFARATATWALNSKLSFQPGVEYNWSKGSGGRIKGEPSIASTAVFLSAEWSPIAKINIRPGLRSILNSDFNAPIVIPSIVTKFILRNNMDLRFSYAYGFRAPTLRELYFDFQRANHNIIGNPNLKAEYSNNITLAYTWRIIHKKGMRLTANLTGFYNDFRDKIAFATSDHDPTVTTYHNIDKNRTAGGSFENAFVWKDFSISVNYSLIGRYNMNSNSNSGMNLGASNINADKFRFYSELSTNTSYQFKFGTVLNFFYKFSGERREYMYNSTTNELYLSGPKSYNWADITASHKILKYLEINAGVKNLFNVTTISNGTSSILIGTGRSYFIGLNFIFKNY